MKQTVVNRELIAFFLKPTKETLPAVQQAWYQASDARWGTAYIYTQLDISLRQIGLRKGPSKAIVSHFVGAVQANLVARPSLADVQQQANPIEENQQTAIQEGGYEPLTPAMLPKPTPLVLLPVTPRDAFRNAFEKLVEEEEAALLKDVRAQARTTARARLLAMLNELEASDA